MSHCTSQEIRLLILEAADDGETKTKIMYKTFLSYDQLESYLVMLKASGLISQKGAYWFKTTEKGQRLTRMNKKVSTVSKGLQVLT